MELCSLVSQSFDGPSATPPRRGIGRRYPPIRHMLRPCRGPMPNIRKRLVAVLLAALAMSSSQLRADPYLAEFAYPFPVQRFDFRSQNQDLWMSYMDIIVPRPNGRTVVLLPGTNF